MSKRKQRIILRFLNTGIRRNAALARILFGVHLESGDRIYWDFTTLVLRRALLQIARPEDYVLEIGTGPYAILPLSIERRTACRIDACDINSEYVRSARGGIERAGSAVYVFQSDLFEQVEGEYNIIFSNTLYIPRSAGKARGIDIMHNQETDWCGGESGYEFIGRLLQQGAQYLSPGGRLLVGFNRGYLSERKVQEMCILNAYRIVSITRMALNPSIVLHLQPNHGLSTPARN